MLGRQWTQSFSGGLLVYGILSLLLALLIGWIHPRPALWNPPGLAPDEVSLSDILSTGESVLWIDARETGSDALETIPGAVPLSHSSFEDNLPLVLESWMPGLRVVVFCDAIYCDSSREIANRLRNEVGLPEIWILHGGWESWVNKTIQ